MSKHTLFLLKPGFFDEGEGPYFCPHCAAVEGLLKYEPELETQLDVRRIDFPRPRQEVIELLGESNQFMPVLVVADDVAAPEDAQVSEETGRAFFLGEIAISEFLHKQLGIIKPH